MRLTPAGRPVTTNAAHAPAGAAGDASSAPAPTPEASSRRARHAAARESIAHALLHGGAQVRAGDAAGAVAGVLDRDGRAGYAYPEITGYYLQWLAWRASEGDPAAPLAARAAAAAQWLARWAAAPEPPTRLALVASPPDWRNRALFTFDVAMVLRGLAAATAHGLLTPPRGLVDALDRLLRRLVGADGALEACAVHLRGDVLPARWSTHRGSFLAKAAAGILDASRTLPIGAPVREAAARTLDASIELAIDSLHAETHPFLYAAEGVLACAHPRRDAALAVLAARLASDLALFAADGVVPDSRGHVSVHRLDIVAQSLRFACALARSPGAQAPGASMRAALADALVRGVAADGTIPFDARADDGVCNVWGAMFAEQALADCAGDGLPSSLRCPSHVV